MLNHKVKIYLALLKKSAKLSPKVAIPIFICTTVNKSSGNFTYLLTFGVVSVMDSGGLIGL